MLESNSNFIVVGVLALILLIPLILMVIYGERFKKCPDPRCTNQCTSPFNPNTSYNVTVTDSSGNVYTLVQYIMNQGAGPWGQLGVIDQSYQGQVQPGWTILCQTINGKQYVGFFANAIGTGLPAGSMTSMWTGSSSGLSSPPVDETFASWFQLQPDQTNKGNYLLFNKGSQLVIDTSSSAISDPTQNAPIFTTSTPTSAQIGSFNFAPLS